MVGCVGNAPTLVLLNFRFTGGSRSLRDYQPEEGCGGGNRTRSFSAYEAGAFPPGSPAIEIWQTLRNWSDQPELHRHPLNGVQKSCYWTMIAIGRRRHALGARAAINDKKNKHRCQLKLAPAGSFHGGCFGVSGTPPGHDWIDSHAKPLAFSKSKEARNQTIQTR